RHPDPGDRRDLPRRPAHRRMEEDMTTNVRPTGSPVLLSARDLTVGYGGEPVIPSLDLDIARGDFTVVVGPNGCGKSTLLKTVARVNRPSSGVVELDGRDVHGMRGRDVARRVSLLPQSAAAPEGIT